MFCRFVSAERIAAFCLGSCCVSNGYCLRQPVGDHRYPARITVLHLDLDLTDWFAAPVCLDKAVIDCNLEICLTRMNWEGNALDHRLEDRLQFSLQLFAC